MYIDLNTNNNSQVALKFFNHSKNGLRNLILPTSTHNIYVCIPRYHKNHTFIKVYVPTLLKIIGRKSLIENSKFTLNKINSNEQTPNQFEIFHFFLHKCLVHTQSHDW